MLGSGGVLVRLKLNPSLLWPKKYKDVAAEIRNHHFLLCETATAVDRWRKETPIGAEHGQPLVALGLGFGWSELLLVAAADSPAKLLDLSGRLRSLSGTCRDSAAKAHFFVTTITTVGFDFHWREKGEEIWEQLSSQGKRRPITAASLLDATVNYSTPVAPVPPKGAIPVFFQIGCHSYPGHEERILDLFADLEQELCTRGLLANEEGTSQLPSSHYVLEVGKRDLWSPPLYLDKGLTPEQAAVLLSLVQRWLRHSGESGTESEIVLSTSDFFTRFGCPGDAARQLSMQPIPDTHVPGSPRTGLAPKKLEELLGDPSTVERIRAALAQLQVPYSRSEQILNLINTFFWAYDREVIWDESTELTPIVFALASFLEHRASWWKATSERGLPQPWSLFVAGELSSPQERFEHGVQRELHFLHDRNIPEILQSFRAYFHNRYLSSYLMQEMPDTNLRYRGSQQQLLSVVNLIVNACADIALGARASLAVIGDASSPEVLSACDVLVVRLNIGSLASPLILESIGHEVGHLFLVELFRIAADRAGQHAWARLTDTGSERAKATTELLDLARDINEEVFFGDLHPQVTESMAERFIESTADFLELKLIGYSGWQEWVRSHWLRTVVAGLPVNPSVDPRKPAVVPYLDEDLVMSVLVRQASVVVADYLAGIPAAEDLVPPGRDPVLWQRLEEFRLYLRENATFGPSERVVQPLRSEAAWKEVVEREIFHHCRWLATSAAIAKSWHFFRALATHVSWEPKEDEPRRSGHLISTVRQAFAGFREEFLDDLLPALYVRHWMNAEQRQKARDHEPEFSARPPGHEDYDKVPWRVTPQPQTYKEQLNEIRKTGVGGSLSPYKTLIFQRGAILACEGKTTERWTKAAVGFYLKLIPLIPAWRSLLLEQVVRIEGGERPAGR